MKYVVVLYDGMADYPVPALGGKTPMMCAKKPNMDYLAKRAEVGLIRTVAPGLKPGSDVANMSVLGFDPMKYYTGRSPLEAASIGIDMKPTDVSLRTNLVTLSEMICLMSKRQLRIIAQTISQPKRLKSLSSILMRSSALTNLSSIQVYRTVTALFGTTAQPTLAK